MIRRPPAGQIRERALAAAETHTAAVPTVAVPLPVGPGALPAPGSAVISDATVARLPLYLRVLRELAAAGVGVVSSIALAQAAGVSSAQLRKDLSVFGSYGTRGVGYDVATLISRLGREVGSAQDWGVVILGVGHLGTALATYGGFAARGFRVVALVDADPGLIGRTVNGVRVEELGALESVLARTGAAIAVIATPAVAAQSVVDRLVAHGVTSILNFAGTVLAVPDGVTVRTVDLGQELQILAFHQQRHARHHQHNEQDGALAFAVAEGERG